MDERIAFEVEAALIDAYPGLTNIVGGHHGSEFGTMHADEIVRRYGAEPAVFKHKALLISVNKSSAETSAYEATRYAWKISKLKAEQAEVILATVQGLIVAAFVADEWLEATEENFPGLEPVPGRWGFVGKKAPPEMRNLYVGKRVPDEYRKAGASNPIKYTWTTHATAIAAEPAVFKHKALLISVNKSAAEGSLYEATRYAWKISKPKAEQAEVILATVQGVILGAFVAEQWLEANAENFPGREERPGRFGFIGREAPDEIAKLYVDKRVPNDLRKRGAANPVKYTWSTGPDSPRDLSTAAIPAP
jgi:hypothetical protein